MAASIEVEVSVLVLCMHTGRCERDEVPRIRRDVLVVQPNRAITFSFPFLWLAEFGDGLVNGGLTNDKLPNLAGVIRAADGCATGQQQHERR